MTITLSKPIVIIILICHSLIFLKWYRMRLNSQEKKIVDTIGKYDEKENRGNRTFLVGKGDKRGEE